MLIASRRKSTLTFAIGVITALGIACTPLGAQALSEESPAPPVESDTAVSQSSPAPPDPALKFTQQTRSFSIVDGRDISDFEVETYSHGTFRLSDFEGQPVVLNFWFPSCPGCLIEKPFIRAAEEKWGERGVVFMGVQLIAVDSVEDGIEFLAENGLTYRNFADNGSFARAFNVFGYPSTVFLDTEHKLFDHKRGAVTDEATIGAKLIQIFENSGNFDFE